MLRGFLLIIICLLPSALMAQIYSLKGSVIDSVTGEKLPFVTILINGVNTQGTSSDSSGNFALKSVKPITSLDVSFVGYTSKHIMFKPTDKTYSILISM